MLEFTHEQLLNHHPPAGLTPRLVPVVARCAEIVHQCVNAAVESGGDGHDGFDEGGLRFAVICDPADLRAHGPLAAFLDCPGEPLPETLIRLEGCHRWPEERAHLLVLSVSDTGADYLVLPDACLTPAWTQALHDLCPAADPAMCTTVRKGTDTMSTRSRIAVKQADGTFRSIYCHFDGYPAGVGETLATHYTNPVNIEQLIALGDLSSLGPVIGEPHPFDDRSDVTSGWCRAYGRDRHEPGMEAKTSADFSALVALTDGCWGEYLYLFADGIWQCYDAMGKALAMPLPERNTSHEEHHP